MLSLLPAAAMAVGVVAACTSGGGDTGDGDSGDGDSGDGPPIADAAPAADAPPPPVCPGGVEVSFATDVQPIFTASCTDNACHDAVAPQTDLDLTEGSAHAALVGATAFQCDRTLVVAGNLEDSYLVNKLTGLDMCSGSLMPKADMRLPGAELDAVLAWVCSGAADD